MNAGRARPAEAGSASPRTSRRPRPIGSLSGGERQAVAIARAMHFDSDLIILDEPTNNLGVAETQGVLQLRAQRARLRPLLHLHRPQHPPRLPGGRPHRRACGAARSSPTTSTRRRPASRRSSASSPACPRLLSGQADLWRLYAATGNSKMATLLFRPALGQLRSPQARWSGRSRMSAEAHRPGRPGERKGDASLQHDAGGERLQRGGMRSRPPRNEHPDDLGRPGHPGVMRRSGKVTGERLDVVPTQSSGGCDPPAKFSCPGLRRCCRLSACSATTYLLRGVVDRECVARAG